MIKKIGKNCKKVDLEKLDKLSIGNESLDRSRNKIVKKQKVNHYKTLTDAQCDQLNSTL